MAKTLKRSGATRKPIRKDRQAISWLLWLRLTTMLAVISTVIVGIFWLQKDDTLPILHVTVDGDFKHVDKAKLVEAVKPYVTGSFINIDVVKLREAGEAAPWVKQVQVKRSWPDTIHLVVEEQRAIANWDNHALVNSDGELFFPAKDSFTKGLAVLEGPEMTSKLMVKNYMEVSQRLKSIDLMITRITMDKRRSWTLKMKKGMTVKLGRADSKRRLERFISVYKSQLSQLENKINIIDMRYTNGLTINWKSGHQPEFNGAV
ncbi:cell division protein FtsQ/DivIB [Pseudomonadota bacterium]|nr:cell division protein FtsQ/DivIB [Pseudomonadota bacterium]